MFLATMVNLEGKVWFYFSCCLLTAYSVSSWFEFFAYICLHTTAAKEEEVEEEDDQMDG